MSERLYTTRRLGIVTAIVDALKNNLNGTGGYQTNLFGNAFPRLKYWDEITDFPSICVTAGSETRQYQGGGYKDRFLNIKIVCYVHDEDDTVAALEQVLEDVETCLEQNSNLKFTTRSGEDEYVTMITIQSIDTDEGVMAPLGVGEILCEARY